MSLLADKSALIIALMDFHAGFLQRMGMVSLFVEAPQLIYNRRRRNPLVPPLTNAEVEIFAPQIPARPPLAVTTNIISDEKTSSDVPSFLPIRDETPSFCNAWSFRPSHFPMHSLQLQHLLPRILMAFSRTMASWSPNLCLIFHQKISSF